MLTATPSGELTCTHWPTSDCKIFHTRFDPAHFSLLQFGNAGIDLPPKIATAVPKRQAEFFHGRLCAQAALRDAGVAQGQVGVGAQREPLWPQGIAGSITHHGAMAAAVVLPAARWAGVGMDVETVGSGQQSAALQETIIMPRERLVLAAHDSAMGMDTLLTLAFSAKESFYKGIYGLVGRVLDFDVISLIGIEASTGTLWFEVMEALGGLYQPGYRFQVAFAAEAGQVMTLFRRAA
ncbi:4'-phosphopantetheinyl transferase [Massilia sp. CF038]|uniref:4'-phosphopantetheinyl transferase family protein n=1 Tax=Massilia sp. CF038 TaxID=1881045 RepID=UPI00092108BE|nr:4'-phosphopantetheinyl transferase superfamily protein [Massilia sp. CF038]SHG61078.1 enterobactin synthetase component D [Massilia sp. CF038]